MIVRSFLYFVFLYHIVKTPIVPPITYSFNYHFHPIKYLYFIFLHYIIKTDYNASGQTFRYIFNSISSSICGTSHHQELYTKGILTEVLEPIMGCSDVQRSNRNRAFNGTGGFRSGIDPRQSRDVEANGKNMFFFFLKLLGWGEKWFVALDITRSKCLSHVSLKSRKRRRAIVPGFHKKWLQEPWHGKGTPKAHQKFSIHEICCFVLEKRPPHLLLHPLS